MKVHSQKALPPLQIDSGDYKFEINGAQTMYGVVSKYRSKLAENWLNENTIRQYSRYYNEIILPEMGNLPMEESTITEIDAILCKYVEENPGTPSGKNRKGSGKYSRTTVFGPIMGCIRRAFWVAEDEGTVAIFFGPIKNHRDWPVSHLPLKSHIFCQNPFLRSWRRKLRRRYSSLQWSPDGRLA